MPLVDGSKWIYGICFRGSQQNKVCSPGKKTCDPSKRAPSFSPVSLAGSLTVEASLLLSVLIGVFVGFFLLFDVLLVQIRVQQALDQSTRQIAAGSYLKELLPDLFVEHAGESDDDDIGYSGPALMKAFQEHFPEVLENGLKTAYLALAVQNQLKNDPSILRRVKGGVSGLNFAWTILHEDTEYIDARVRYTITIWGLPDGLNEITYVQRCRKRCWIGLDPPKPPDGGGGATGADGKDEEGTKEDHEDGDVVYITRYGTVYHENERCSYLLRDIKTLEYENAIQVRNDSGRKYKPCEYCVGNNPNAHVYVTREGLHYHNRKNCGGLLRYIQQIKRSEIGLRPLCKQCERKLREEEKRD